MKNKESIKKRIDMIKQESDLTKSICLLSDLTYEIGIDACSEREEIVSDIKMLKGLLTGNGVKDGSIIKRVEDLERAMKGIETTLNKIDTFLRGDKSSDSIEKSLYARVVESERIAKNVVKLSWTVIGLLVTYFVTHLLGLLGA
ncbi:MAG: hypothetical protein GX139_13405 [Armatimonadetes bacterium]|nr:hypothetical protein [Armatimonadota bacterium]